MVATYILDENELTDSFYHQLKQQFKNKRITITIEEAIDETAYLLTNPANARHLFSAIENSQKESGLISVSMDNLKKQLSE